MFQQPNWLRQLIRRNTKPITENQAGVWKKRLALGYALIAWNAFGIVCYLIYTGKGGWMTQKQEEEANMTPGNIECRSCLLILLHNRLNFLIPPDTGTDKVENKIQFKNKAI